MIANTHRFLPRRSGAVLLAAAGLALSGAVLSPVSAASDTVRDRVGDAVASRGDRPMDIRSVTVRNRDRSILVITRLATKAKGDLIVGIDPRRGGAGLRMISTHRPNGQDRDVIEPFALIFGDDGDPVEDADVNTDCPRYRVTWSDDDRVARMVLPSRCLAGGDYGAIRYAVLTEVGADSDLAHYGRRGQRTYVARG